MKRLVLNALALLSLLFFYTSCTKNEGMEFSKVDLNVVGKSNLLPDSSTNTCNIDIQLLFPIKFKDEVVLNKIQASIVKFAFDSTYVAFEPDSAAKLFVERTLKEHNKFIADYINRPEFKDNLAITLGEEWKLSSMILNNDNKMLAYQLDKYAFTGGAHGYESSTFLMYDLSTGDMITEENIFEKGYESLVTQLMIKDIMKTNGYKNEDEMASAGYMFPENIAPNGNFYADSTGLHYMFNPYDIGAYSVGQVEVNLSYVDLKSKLKAESPISYLIKK